MNRPTERPIGLVIITIIFIVFTILNIFLFIKPLTIQNSAFLGRLSALSWAILDGLIVCGLILMAPWVRKLFVIAYVISLIAALFSRDLHTGIFIIVLWSIIYLPSIQYLRRQKIRKLFLPP